MRPLSPRPTPHRRGVTLVEMLVVVALLVLMMTILVQIFQSATGAVSTQRAYAEMDMNLRRIDSVIRRDLNGITARMTPPLDPKDNLGYFEYGENALSDAQGEDSDDYLAFTAKAPEGQPFIGRIYVPPQFATIGAPPATVLIGGNQFVTFTSQYAEIIYFLRNGNLYRRVFLIAPERKGSLSAGVSLVGGVPTLNSAINGGFYVRLIGPGQFVNSISTDTTATAVSWQGMNDISARPSPYSIATTGGAWAPIPNSLGDLTNRENRAFHSRFANDFVKNTDGTVTPDGVADDQNMDGVPDYYQTLYPNNYMSLVNEPAPHTRYATYDAMAFPFVFPFAYSVPMPTSGTSQGLIHGLAPHGYIKGTTLPPSPTDSPAGPYRPNHSPIDVGDNLTVPTAAAQNQTWWGFPTWAETLSPFWTDPVTRVNNGTATPSQATGLSWVNRTGGTPTWLPPQATQPFNDGVGTTTYASPAFLAAGAGTAEPIWQDDLIMTGVRSFDVKAYDNLKSDYADLGYLDLDNLASGVTITTAQLLTFGHEGRIPPMSYDNRSDPVSGVSLGDDNATTLRVRRVFDTWSTDYAVAPATSVVPGYGPPFSNPVYPSYPAPYPIALRGIQIQIRVVDSTNTKIKTLTIRQDFADKL